MQKSEADDQSWARGREQARASRPTTPESADRREVGICLGVRGACHHSEGGTGGTNTAPQKKFTPSGRTIIPMNPSMQTRLTNVANKVVGTVGLPSNNTQGLGHHETVLQETRGKATEHIGPATALRRECSYTVLHTAAQHSQKCVFHHPPPQEGHGLLNDTGRKTRRHVPESFQYRRY